MGLSSKEREYSRKKTIVFNSFNSLNSFNSKVERKRNLNY